MDQRGSQGGPRGFLSTSAHATATLFSVADVIGLGSLKQMFWIAAPWVVARVPTHHAFGQGPVVGQLPSRLVRSHRKLCGRLVTGSSELDLSVAVPILWPQPWPALVGIANTDLCPEPSCCEFQELEPSGVAGGPRNESAGAPIASAIVGILGYPSRLRTNAVSAGNRRAGLGGTEFSGLVSRCLPPKPRIQPI